MKIEYNKMGARIKKARLRKNLTQELVSEKSGISLSHLSNIETGKTKVSLSTLISICNVLDITVDNVLQDSVNSYDSLFVHEVISLCEECNSDEKRIIRNVLKTLITELKSK